MKKVCLLLFMGALMSGCVFYGPVAGYMDTQKLPELSRTGDSLKNVQLEIARTSSITGIPDKGTLAEKSQYVVPLPFVGFFGGKLLMKPGDTSLVSPMYDNLDVSLRNEMAASFPKSMQGNYVLKVKVDSSSCAFRYKRKGYVVWIFFIQFGGKKEYCSPRDISLSVSYELLDNGVVVKKGAFTKTSHSDEKISAATPWPQAKPYDPTNPADSPSAAAVRQQGAFAFGGIGATLSKGLEHTFYAYNDLIVDVSKQIVAETKDSVK